MLGAKVMAKILNLYQIDNGVEKKKKCNLVQIKSKHQIWAQFYFMGLNH